MSSSHDHVSPTTPLSDGNAFIDLDGNIRTTGTYDELNERVSDVEEPKKTNRPEEIAWAQQRLKLWQPLLTLPYAIGTLMSLGIGLLVLGIIIMVFSTKLDVFRAVYDADTDETINPDFITIKNADNCRLDAPEDANSFDASHVCFITFIIPADVEGTAHIYYQLDNYFQNHRRFVTSLTATQFVDNWRPGDSTSTCEPTLTAVSETCNGTVCSSEQIERDLFSCGIVANSMFNDIFWLHHGILPDGKELGREDFITTGIARDFISNSFANPSFDVNGDKFLPIWNNPNYSRIVPPPGAVPPAQINDDYGNSTAWVIDPPGEGLENEHWRVWVDLAATSRFRKPYGRIERAIPAGTNLTFAVQSNFFVRSFSGRKSLIIAQISWFGSENYELGVFFLTMGLVLLVFGIFFLRRMLSNPRTLGDAKALKWKVE